jgi:Holliday junction DNA helicase RuvA
MIGKLTGRIDFVGNDHVIVDVGGVGYLVHCSSAALSRLSAGMDVSLFIETKVSDDAIRLYGFVAVEEREWFRLLQTVQGVGARVALAILSVVKTSDLERSIVLGDKTIVGRASGVGPKLAGRIVSELKGKAPALVMQRHADGGAAASHLSDAHPAESDAIAALMNLGYSQQAAAEAVARAGHDKDVMPLDILIRESLRQLAK